MSLKLRWRNAPGPLRYVYRKAGASMVDGESSRTCPKIASANAKPCVLNHRPADHGSIQLAAQCFRSDVRMFGRSTVDITIS
jgi:hypothetical protein